MPISSDEFEELRTSDDGPRPGTNAAAILSFLTENPDTAYTQSEIAAATDVKQGSVGPTLVRLRERGRVDHRGTYWRLSDHERSVGAASDHAAAAAAAREGSEETPSYDDWQEHAVDPRDGDAPVGDAGGPDETDD